MTEIKRYDERDNVQGRNELNPGSPEWKAYYQNHPEMEAADLAQYALPGAMKVGASADIKGIR